MISSEEKRKRPKQALLEIALLEKRKLLVEKIYKVPIQINKCPFFFFFFLSQAKYSSFRH